MTMPSSTRSSAPSAPVSSDSVTGALGRFSFSHAIVVGALVDDLPAARRLRLHERIALALEARQAAHPVHAAELALHFVHAAALGHGPQALRWARSAGDEA